MKRSVLDNAALCGVVGAVVYVVVTLVVCALIPFGLFI